MKAIKRNGTLPTTPFKKGDLIVYEGKEQTNIIVLNRISEEAQGDIFYNTILVLSREECPYIKHFSSTEDFRIWFNNDSVRYATASEANLLVNALQILLSANREPGCYMQSMDLTEFYYSRARL